MAATKRQQISNFLTANGFSGTFQGDLFEQVINAIELYTNKKDTKTKVNKMSEEDVAAYNLAANQFINYFPAIKIPTTGKYAREPQKEVVEALIWFRSNYEHFDFGTIFRATQRYVKEHEVKNWEYMQTCKYFIRKQQKDKSWISNLAGYCQQIQDGVGYDQDIKHITNKVV